MIYENVFNTIQFFDDLINFDNKQCKIFTRLTNTYRKFHNVNFLIIIHCDMTKTLKLSFSHLF